MNEVTGQLIVKIGFGLIMAAIAWTMVASLVFLLGTGLLPDFPHPFYQWWLYALNFDGNPRVALWLKIGAGAGIIPLLVMISAVIVRGQQAVAPRLRRPLFGGTVKTPRAVTDNQGHADWMSMDRAQERFPGTNPVFGGIVLGEAYRVDQDKVAGQRFDPEDPKSWGRGGSAPLLIDGCTQGSTHSLMISGSGGYKTTAAISTLLTWTGSAVILDPAGEMAPMLRKAREAMGHKVYEISPSSDTGVNVLRWIDITSPVAATNIEAVVTWVCGEPKPGADRKNDFFDAMGRKLIQCFTAALLWDQTVTPEEKTLRAVRLAIAQPSDVIRGMLRGIFTASPSPYARELAGPLSGLVDVTFSGVLASADRLTSWLANGAFANLVSGNSFAPEELLRGKTTIFLKMPLKVLQSTPGITRTLIGGLLNTAYEADGHVSGRILYLLDEVARLGYMGIIETARDAGRKYGITMHLLYQSTGQIVEQWGEQGARAWYDSVSWRGYAAVQDLQTAEELEAVFGSYGVIASSEGINTGRSGKALEASSLSRGGNVNFQEISRPLIRKSELLNDVREDEMFVIIRGSPPLRCGRAIYFRRPEMAARVTANRFYKTVTASND